MLTRRVRGRRFLLRPCNKTNDIVEYVVAVVAKKWKIRVHAVTVMSNHWHVCITDDTGHVVEFQRDCHSFIARALNASFGDFENLWNVSTSGSRVECQQVDDLISKIAYTMANPVEAGLVRNGKRWPGLRCAWPVQRKPIARPRYFFRGVEERGRWPDVATLQLHRFDGYERLCDNDLAGLIDGAIEEREAFFRRQYDKDGRKFLGRRKVLRQSRHHRPRGHEPRFDISPQIACRGKWLRIERLALRQKWLVRYAGALLAWRGGNREILFPEGTYKMRVVHQVRCAEASHH